MPQRRDLLLSGGGASDYRTLACGLQHRTSSFVFGVPGTGTGGNLASGCWRNNPGVWRCGKHKPFSTSPHPRRLRRRPNSARGVTLTLTFYLVQTIGQVTKTSTALLSNPLKTCLFHAVAFGC